MKLGFITNSFAWAGENNLDTIAEWAAANGFTDLEAGPSIPLDEALFEQVKAKHDIDISTFIYCRNFLDEKEGAMHLQNLRDRIEFAAKVGADKVICSTGVSPRALIEGNPVRYDPESCIDEVAEVFKGVMELAHKHNIKVGFENCPFMFNIAISPYMWERLFEKIDSPLVGMVFDPSHLVWQMIDPLPLVRQFAHRIFHVHGKDCEILQDMLARMGILHTIVSLDEAADKGEGLKTYEHSWYRYRLPGFGDLDWTRLISDLQITGFDGTISIEHEDPIWCGTLDKIKKGLLLSRDYLNQYL
ncbi:sugar phosphate isomerase/epimerase [Ruminococcaceae bacterium OttesenSCG-928-L11]|nr:sugar phosphate isomerase/epimerase [Ruminococcaceae bacterium OttesenSCG-928-L11]